MVIGELIVTLGTDLADFDKGIDKAVSKMDRAGSRLSSIGKSLTLGLTAPIVGIGVGALAASVNFELAMTGVEKTIDATTPEIEAMGDAFKDMSETMPATASEIAKVGESAGQLGIVKEDIVAFVKTMEDLGVSTNLTADEAATAFAQLGNIMGFPTDQVDNLGSALVALGNKGSSTESQILFMAQGMAGAAVQAGIAADEVLGFAAAVADTGIPVERGATAMARVFTDMETAVALGGKELRQFADVAGISSAQFAQSFKDDAAGAVLQFVQGLDHLSERGKNMSVVLKEMGFSEARVSDLLKRLAADSDNVKTALERSSTATKENTALTEEAEKFYAATANQLKALKNEFVNVGIELGDVLLPILKISIGAFSKFVDVLGFVVGVFEKMTPSQQHLIVGMLATAAVLGPVLVAAGTLITLFASLAPLAVFLGTTVAGLAGVFGLFIVAGGAVVAGGLAIVDNWKIIKFEAQSLYDKIAPIFNKIGKVVEAVVHPVQFATGAFAKMYDDVVGNSYVPDMMNGIAKQFARLNGIMTNPTWIETARTADAFKNMQGEISLLEMVLDRQAAAVTNLMGLRLDLSLTSDADEAAKLRTKIAETEAELRKLTKMADEMAPLNAALKEAADTLRLLSNMPDIKLHIAGETGTGTGTSKTQTFLNGDFNLRDLMEVLPLFEQAVRSSTESMDQNTLIWQRVGMHAQDAGKFLLNAGKSFLSGVGNIFGQIFSMFNPLRIITAALDEAFRQAGVSLEPFMDAVSEIASILLTALQPVLDALVPVFQAFVPIIRELAPIISAVGQIFAALFKAVAPILGAMVPLLRLLFPAFKFLAIVTTYLGQAVTFVGQIIFTVASGLANAIGAVLKGIGKFLNILPGSIGNPLIKAGEGMQSIGKEFGNTADELGKAFTELGKAREEIRGITLDEPIATAATGLTDVGDAAGGAAVAVDAFAASLGAMGGVGSPGVGATPATQPRGATGAPVAAPAPASSIALGPVTIQTTGEGKATYRALYEEIERMVRAGGPDGRALLAALPRPS